MRRLSFSSARLAALFYFAATALASPIPAFPLTSRSPTCHNAPATVAGTLFTPRALRPLPRHETSTVLWCAPHSSTYIILDIITSTISPPLVTLFNGALFYIAKRIQDHGDGVVLGGSFHWAEDRSGMQLSTWNANNHQTTYGVLSAAVGALEDYMLRTGLWGTVKFWIFDGGNQVGAGEIA